MSLSITDKTRHTVGIGTLLERTAHTIALRPSTLSVSDEDLDVGVSNSTGFVSMHTIRNVLYGTDMGV